MYKFFGKLFVKDYKDLKNDEVRAKYGSMAGTIGIITNLMLGTLKVVLGLITASISIITDAINNITDSVSSLVTIIGYKISTKKADEDHPFGHQRVEFISGLIVAVLMLVVAVLLLKESVLKIFDKDYTVTFDIITIILLSVSVIVKLWQSFFYKSVGKAINSISLKANSKDSLNDAISTICVLIGVLINVLSGGKINIDGYVGTVLALYVIYSSVNLIIEASDPLIGTIPPVEKINEYKHKIKSYDGILGVHDVVCHTYGPTKLFMTAHAEVSSKVDVLISHEILDDIERDFRNQLNIDLTLHMDPIEDDDEFTNTLRFHIREKVKEIGPELDIHDFRVVKGENHTNIIFDCELPYSVEMTKNELREKLIQIVKDIDSSYNLVLQIDQMYDRK